MRKDINSLPSFKGHPHIDDLGGGFFKYRLEIADKPASKSYKKLVGEIKDTSPKENRLRIFGDKKLKPRLGKAKRKKGR